MLGDKAEWGAAEELLAQAVDWLAMLEWRTRAAHFKGPHDPPELVPRPGDGGLPDQVAMVAPPKMSSPAELKSFFGTDVVIVTDS